MKKEILTNLIDNKKAAILKLLLTSAEELYLKEIADKSKVPIATTFRILQELIALEIIEKREWKTSKTYKCKQDEKVQFLKELFYEEYDGVAEFVSNIRSIEGIQQIIQHGGKKKGKANILLIGENLDASGIELVATAVREKGFDLTYLTLTRAQYDQMVKMGLYSGEKIVLK